MISVRTHIDYRPKRVTDAVDRAAFKNLRHAAASIRKDAIASIKLDKTVLGYFRKRNKKGQWVTVKRYRPSRPGTPPHAHRNLGFFRRGIRFDADEKSAVIGPAKSQMGDVMAIHEHGEYVAGKPYDKRPTMVSALERNLDRIAQSWAGSVG